MLGERRVGAAADEPVQFRLARGYARWAYHYRLGTKMPDPRSPIDAAVREERLRMKRALARHWLDARRARRLRAANVTPLPTCFLIR
jgi:hypothetical protein